MIISRTALKPYFFILMFFSAFTSFAQQPAQINVKSIQLYKQAFWTNAVLTIQADGLSDTSFAAANFGIFGFENCEPCELGSSFSTSFSPNNFHGAFRGGQNGNVYVRLIITGISSGIRLRPFYRQKRVYINVPAQIQGRVEVLNEFFVITAVDDDVKLSGIQNYEFINTYETSLSRRLFAYKAMTYSFSEAD